MSAGPGISVVIVTFNGVDFTPPSLESIPSGIEVVVVDNASRDGTPEMIASRFPQVRLIRNSVNLGFARAVNQGIAATAGRYICLLNNDARLSPEALPALAGYLDRHPEAGVVAPQLLHEDGTKQHSFDNFPSWATILLNKSLLRFLLPGRYPSKNQDLPEPREVESVIGACMMVRRSLIETIGPLDESYFLFLEETDWCLRASRSGAKVVFVPSASVVHLQGMSRDRVRFRGKIEYVRSLFTFLRRNRPGSYRLVRLLYPLKSLFGVVFGTLGLVTARGRIRWAETAAVLGWQLCGCPRRFGLSMAAEPRYLTLRDNARVLEPHLEAFNDFDSKTKQQKVVKDLRHKRTVEFASGGKTYLVKMYKTDSWGRKIAAWFGGSKATREFRVSLELQRRGVPAVPVVAMRESGDLRWVACEKLEGWDQLQGVLLSEVTPGSSRRDLCRRYGLFARRLHDAGVWQYDFNPSNILVRGREMLLIDFERAQVRDRALPEPERLYLIAKMNRLPRLSRSDRLRFLHGYVAAHADEGPRLAGIVAELARRGKEQWETDLDRAEDRCTAENRDFGAFDLGDASGHYLKVRPERVPAGVTLEEVRTAMGIGSPFRIQEVEDALEGWRGANRKVREGGPVPLAVILKKGERKGRIVFRN